MISSPGCNDLDTMVPAAERNATPFCDPRISWMIGAMPPQQHAAQDRAGSILAVAVTSVVPAMYAPLFTFKIPPGSAPVITGTTMLNGWFEDRPMYPGCPPVFVYDTFANASPPTTRENIFPNPPSLADIFTSSDMNIIAPGSDMICSCGASVRETMPYLSPMISNPKGTCCGPTTVIPLMLDGLPIVSMPTTVAMGRLACAPAYCGGAYCGGGAPCCG
mmetsp:Transcript_8777/g.28893  ORF Transcript_8777/g.28893 Transcript_8777/m.28893 type:complete len:219 (-) Transcript_8777:206-862(-)